MIVSSSKMSRTVRQPAAIRDVGVRDDDTATATLRCFGATEKNIALRSDAPATLCFIRGTGKMVVRDALVEYRDGEWIEISDMTAFHIFPATDTVLLTIRKPERNIGEARKETSPRRMRAQQVIEQENLMFRVGGN